MDQGYRHSFTLVPSTTAPFAADSAADRSTKNLSRLVGELFLNQTEPVRVHKIQVEMQDEKKGCENRVKESQTLCCHHPETTDYTDSFLYQ